MRRIVILGNSGAGKSTLARQLGAKLGLPAVHLDVLFYEPGWRPAASEIFRRRVTQALAGDGWIVDGNFLGLVGDLSLPRADTILWIEQPRWRSLVRASWRSVDRRGRDRPDLPAGCRDGLDRETLSFIWTFDRIARRNIEHILAHQAPSKPVHRLRGDRGVAAFLRQAGR